MQVDKKPSLTVNQYTYPLQTRGRRHQGVLPSNFEPVNTEFLILGDPISHSIFPFDQRNCQSTKAQPSPSIGNYQEQRDSTNDRQTSRGGPKWKKENKMERDT